MYVYVCVCVCVCLCLCVHVRVHLCVREWCNGYHRCKPPVVMIIVVVNGR